MKYIVVAKFKDLEDNNHIYKVGDDYPHKDKDIKDISKERIEQLTTTNNKLNKILIKEDKKKEAETSEVDNAEGEKENPETSEADNVEGEKETSETSEADTIEGKKEESKISAEDIKNNKTTTKTKK